MGENDELTRSHTELYTYGLHQVLTTTWSRALTGQRLDLVPAEKVSDTPYMYVPNVQTTHNTLLVIRHESRNVHIHLQVQ